MVCSISSENFLWLCIQILFPIYIFLISVKLGKKGLVTTDTFLSFCQNLALCTAALMYILSRDRLNMDLDRACLELMIKLLELDQDYSGHQDQLTAKEVAKVKEKIRKLCETVHNKHLDLENITVGCPYIIKYKT